jgi:hypothetical protein
MSSLINPNNIDGNYPVAGQDNNSQGFRDNFTNTRINFQYAENEINELQTKAILKTALTGTTLDNNMSDNLIYAAKIRDFSGVKAVPVGTTGTVTLDYTAAHYQTISTSGSVTLAFSNFPPSGQYGYLRLQINITNVGHTLTLPAAVSLGLSGIQGISPGTSGVPNTITFGSTGYYEFAFSSSDAGGTITLFDLNRALINFTVADLNLADVYATGVVSATGNVIGGNVNTGGLMSSAGNVIGGNINTSGLMSATGNVIGGNINTSGTVSSTGNVAAVNINGSIRPISGTTTVAPLQFTSGVVLSTPESGVMEYDGSVFYGTPVGGATGSQRGVIATSHVIVVPTAGRVLAQNTNPQAIFDNPTNGALTVTASTTYHMQAQIIISNSAAPAAAHSYSLAFDLGGGGSLTSIAYTVISSLSSGVPLNGSTTTRSALGTGVGAVQVTGSSSASNEYVILSIDGMVRTNAAGTFTPQIQFNTNAPGGTSTVMENSYWQMTPLGSSSLISVGNWS